MIPPYSFAKTLLSCTVFIAAITACSHISHQISLSDPAAHADSDMQKVLAAQKTLNPKPIETLTPAQARLQPSPADGVKKVIVENGDNPDDPMDIITKNITVSGSAGTLPARVYMPKKSNLKKALPVVVYYHGGGWVIANLDTYDATPRAIAKMTHAIVISMHYRQAPEFKFPAAHDDAFATYKWALKNASALGGDPSNIAIMGESAGGNLAINTAIKARDARIQAPVHQVLIYPVAGTDMRTASYIENANAKPLNKAMMGWFMKYVIRSDADKKDPRLDLINKANLHGLPSATIITADIDPLRSDGEMLAAKLKEANVPVHYKNYEGVTHEFFGMGTVVAKAKDAESEVAADLKSAFSK